MAEQIVPSNDVILKAVQDTLVISTTDLQGVITYANDLFCKRSVQRYVGYYPSR